MRRLMFLLVAFSFLGTMVGCTTCGSRGCGFGGGNGNGCGTAGCAGGHGAGGLGAGHSHGVCDCEFDDYCTSRTPWIRFGGAITTVPSTTVIVPAGPISEPVPLPKTLPNGKTKL